VALPGAPALISLPILQLIAAEVPDPGALELDSYELTASTAHGGTLHLTIDARDSLGLLGALLQQLAQLTLYPIEMHIETQAGRAQDALWLYTDQPQHRVTDLQDMVERTLVAALRTRGA
jgi:UTP:GlnB (protein PII) uridylyltransferase